MYGPRFWLLCRHSVRRPGPAITLELKSSAFDPRETYGPSFHRKDRSTRHLINLVNSDGRINLKIIARFDLKGSFQGRATAKPESEIDPTKTLKDLDLNHVFWLQKLWFQEFCRQVDRDSNFLEREKIMDYSLLVGLQCHEGGIPRSSGVLRPTGYFWSSMEINVSMNLKPMVA
ncbi:hypothetical protein V6N11_037586 [Hibiscus sabdariffa]|uniref:Uncharacterized protein n=2 Tax=Hibiscus sabdariffa TaxID=183260 RepID=A0ABR2PC54_9ROSI